MKKQPQITEATKKKLVDAFWSLYKVKNIEKITIKEITDKAGYNRSTFYQYFADVYDVLEYMEDTLISYMKENIVINSIKDDKDEIFLHKISSIYEEKGEYLNVLFNVQRNPSFIKKFKGVFKPALYLVFGKSSVDNIYSDIIFEFSMSAIIGAFTYWYTNRELISTDEFIVLVRSLLANGAAEQIQSL